MSGAFPPPVGEDWKTWARQLSQYLGRTQPRLRHKLPSDVPSENGIILWDEVNGYPVVSKNGAWVQIQMVPKMACEVIHIPTSEVPAAWPALGGFVNKAAQRYSRDYDMKHMQEAIFDGKAALFGVFKGGEPMAAVVTSEIVYPKRKVMLIELVGGANMREWADVFVQQMVGIAKRAGYAAIEARARKGWSRALKSYNVKQVYIAYELEI